METLRAGIRQQTLCSCFGNANDLCVGGMDIFEHIIAKLKFLELLL